MTLMRKVGQSSSPLTRPCQINLSKGLLITGSNSDSRTLVLIEEVTIHLSFTTRGMISYLILPFDVLTRLLTNIDFIFTVVMISERDQRIHCGCLILGS